MEGSGYGLLLGTIAVFTWWTEEDHDKDFGTLSLQEPAIFEAGVHIFPCPWCQKIDDSGPSACHLWTSLNGSYL